MNNSQALMQSLQLLKKNKENVDKHDKNRLKIDGLVKQLDKLAIDFVNDYQLYNKTKNTIQAKMTSFSEEPNYSKQILVNSPSVGTNSTFLGCYKNTKSMEYTGSMSFDRCRENAFDLQKPFFSVQSEDGKNNCYVGHNLQNIIKEGLQYNFVPMWQSVDTIKRGSSETYQLKVFYTTFAIIDSKQNVIYSNDIDGAVNEMKLEIEKKKEMANKETTKNDNVEGKSTIAVGSSGSRTKIITLPDKNVTVSPKPVNPQNRGWSDRFETKIIDDKLHVTRLDAAQGWGQNLILESKPKKTESKEADQANENVSKLSSLLMISDDGNLVLKTDEDILWTANRNDTKSTVVDEWIPVNNPTNKYKRAYMRTGEFLDSQESISSQNGKYKMEFANGALRLLAATASCVDNNRIGNKVSVGLHMINKSNYDVRNGYGSSGTGETRFNISKGDCMNECDNDDKCLGAEYKMDKTSTCILKGDVGTIYEDEKSSLLLKNDENMLDDRIYLGKIGYIDENDTLHEYPKSMIKYTDEMYKSYENTTSDGKTIQTLNGNIEQAILACNKLSICGGFTHNIETNTIELKDNTIYPETQKKFENDTTLYTRGFILDNHNSCDKTYETVKTDFWKNYDVLNKITMVDEKTHKCGVSNLIDVDLAELKRIYERLNLHTASIERIFKSLNKLNVKIDHNVKDIQTEMKQSVGEVRTSTSKMEDKNKSIKKEGFTGVNHMSMECNSVNTLVKRIDTTALSLSIAFLFIGGLLLYSRK